MWFDKIRAEGVFSYVIIVAATSLVGCGDTCFFGFFNSGTGVVVVGAANTTPPCSLKQTKAAVNVIALKSTVCERCTSDARIEHAFVAMRSIQLQPAATNDASRNWIEIGPELAHEPRNIDLLGDPVSEMLLENRRIQADTYRKLRLRFCAESDSDEECPVATVCPGTVRSCIIMADGRIELLYWPGEPELVIPIRTMETLEGDGLLAVLPDSIVDLRLNLDLRRAFTPSSIQRSRLENVLFGRATAVRRWSKEATNFKSD